MIEKILSEIDISLYDNTDKYSYNGQAVPRVTELLSSMLHEDYLMTWANSIGLYKKQKYADVMKKASLIGTYSHELVEDFINSQLYDITKYDIRDYSVHTSVINCVESFKSWYEQVFSNNQVQVIGMEEKLSCRWFGGTYDALLNINGKVYLVDFKTSNNVSYKYFLQLAAYRYMLFNEKNINIDGVIILQLSKKDVSFNEYILDFSINEHYDFIESCCECFLSLVYAYFNKLHVQKQYSNIFGGK